MSVCGFVPKDLMDLFHSEVPNLILFEQQEISPIVRNHHSPGKEKLDSILLFFLKQNCNVMDSTQNPPPPIKYNLKYIYTFD